MKAEMVRAGVGRVRAALEGWRGRRRQGDRIPEGLWRQAVGAARRYGVSAVSQALRLDYYQLQRRVRRCAGSSERQSLGAPLFVELSAAAAGERSKTEGPVACWMELEKGNGARMRLWLRDAAGVDWGKLKEAFLAA